jgi:DNA-binding transcriptional LysR family regulator
VPWDELETFLATARAGRTGAAATQLGVDRTTVGRRIAALEARLGVPLFHRTREGLRPTPAGERALAHAERMDAAARGLAAEVAPPDRVTGTVRLAVTEAIAPFLIDQGLLDVCDAHPGLVVELLAGNRRLDLATGECDLALRMDPIKGADLRARCVSRSAVALFASRAYVERRGSPRTPEQLDGHALLVPSGELGAMPEARWLAAQRGVGTFTSNSLSSLVSAARQGRGIVPITRLWGAREPELVPLFDVPGVPERAIWLVSTAPAGSRPACGVVVQRLLDLFAAV